MSAPERRVQSWASRAELRVLRRIAAAVCSALLLGSCAAARTPPPSGQKLATLVGFVAAPVVLVTASAVLLATLASKHTTAGALLRELTAEWRHAETPPTRRACVRAQVMIFARRVRLLWIATVCLYVAVTCFLVTTLEVMLSPYASKLALLGIVTLPLGIILVLAGVFLQLEEVRLSRHSLAAEICDVAENSPRETSWGAPIQH
jgi:hypothetical protein